MVGVAILSPPGAAGALPGGADLLVSGGRQAAGADAGVGGGREGEARLVEASCRR